MLMGVSPKLLRYYRQTSILKRNKRHWDALYRLFHLMCIRGIISVVSTLLPFYGNKETERAPWRSMSNNYRLGRLKCRFVGLSLWLLHCYRRTSTRNRNRYYWDQVTASTDSAVWKAYFWCNLSGFCATINTHQHWINMMSAEIRIIDLAISSRTEAVSRWYLSCYHHTSTLKYDRVPLRDNMWT